jgi:hypothetical protein
MEESIMKTNSIITLVFAVSTLVVFGNGCNLSDLNNGGGGGAVITSSFACTQYGGGSPTECFLYPSTEDQSSVDVTCESISGTASNGCTTANLLGTCSDYNNANGVVTYFYQSSTITSQSVASGLCAGENGIFTAQ